MHKANFEIVDNICNYQVSVFYLKPYFLIGRLRISNIQKRIITEDFVESITVLVQILTGIH